MVNYGWRTVFTFFSIPGIILSILWYLMVHNRPEQSPYCNSAEAEYIRGVTLPAAGPEKPGVIPGSFELLDKLIRTKHVKVLQTNREVFRSWNVWGAALTYFFIGFVTYGMMTWVPTYLVKVKGYSFSKMGWVAASPWAGAFVGQIIGGWISDRLFLKRRKPLQVFGPLSLIVMMAILMHAPNDALKLSVILFLTGGLLNMAWPMYFAYPMGLTTEKTYPTAISIVTSVGNMSGFFSPMIGGYLLDRYKSFDVVFMFLALCALLSILTVLTIEEPVRT
jgi:sugar phosphate permease